MSLCEHCEHARVEQGVLHRNKNCMHCKNNGSNSYANENIYDGFVQKVSNCTKNRDKWPCVVVCYGQDCIYWREKGEKHDKA